MFECDTTAETFLTIKQKKNIWMAFEKTTIES